MGFKGRSSTALNTGEITKIKLTKHDMDLFATVTLHLRAIWTYFTSVFYAT